VKERLWYPEYEFDVHAGDFHVFFPNYMHETYVNPLANKNKRTHSNDSNTNRVDPRKESDSLPTSSTKDAQSKTKDSESKNAVTSEGGDPKRLSTDIDQGSERNHTETADFDESDCTVASTFQYQLPVPTRYFRAFIPRIAHSALGYDERCHLRFMPYV
jgi:hypothetical protein